MRIFSEGSRSFKATEEKNMHGSVNMLAKPLNNSGRYGSSKDCQSWIFHKYNVNCCTFPLIPGKCCVYTGNFKIPNNWTSHESVGGEVGDREVNAIKAGAEDTVMLVINPSEESLTKAKRHSKSTRKLKSCMFCLKAHHTSLGSLDFYSAAGASECFPKWQTLPPLTQTITGQPHNLLLLGCGEVKIFSRNQEDNTGRYPDIISRIPKIKLPSVTSFILDTEAVAWDREKKQIQPFQVLTTRKRKEVDAAEIQVQVCLYAFDLIYLNGESLVREPLSRRRQLLRENFVETEGEFVFATSLDTKDSEQIAEFLEQSVKDSCEGLMEIAKRSHNWLKLKKDYLEGVGDTLDLVVIGAYLGKGKRAGRYGGFLLASYDEESEEFQAICKLGTGFSDEELEEHHQRLQALVLPTLRSYVRADGAVAPDHWLDPSDVWEVKCADLSLSPIYPAARGLVDGEKGISLRLPRFIRVREDKKPEQATTSAKVAGLYKKQSQIQNQQGAEPDSEQEEFY
ncbi:hypothetical protein E5288_WYG020034 [Bos mutus]|uniref:DNA ligase 1 n=1 Tax=Bos mutus TaxID=72004 RepID=A0A6B0RNT6_9CETA|nr:hypothetical protein [Bos mutus]